MTGRGASRTARAKGAAHAVGHGAKSGAVAAGHGAKTGFALVKDMFARAGRNNISIVSAGVAFYVFLAMVPLLAATVLVYGLIASPQTVAHDIGSISQVLPEAAAGLFADQLQSVVQTSAGKKGVGLVIAFAFALFGARNGAGSILTALNIAHGVPEARGIIAANLVAIGITLGGVIAVIVAVVAMGVLTALVGWVGGVIALAGSAITYLFLFAVGAGGTAALFRYAPNRPAPAWRKVFPGAFLAAGGWLVLTLCFGIYVSNFGNYNATYGSLSAVVVLLTWLYLSAFILLLGAELNAAWGDRAAGYRGLEVG